MTLFDDISERQSMPLSLLSLQFPLLSLLFPPPRYLAPSFSFPLCFQFPPPCSQFAGYYQHKKKSAWCMCYRPSCTSELIGIDLALRLGIDWISTQSALLLNYPIASKHRTQWHPKHMDTAPARATQDPPRVWQNSLGSCYPFPNLRSQGKNQEGKSVGCLLSFVPIAKLWKI